MSIHFFKKLTLPKLRLLAHTIGSPILRILEVVREALNISKPNSKAVMEDDEIDVQLTARAVAPVDATFCAKEAASLHLVGQSVVVLLALLEGQINMSCGKEAANALQNCRYVSMPSSLLVPVAKAHSIHNYCRCYLTQKPQQYIYPGVKTTHEEIQLRYRISYQTKTTFATLLYNTQTTAVCVCVFIKLQVYLLNYI